MGFIYIYIYNYYTILIDMSMTHKDPNHQLWIHIVHLTKQSHLKVGLEDAPELSIISFNLQQCRNRPFLKMC